MPNLGFYLSESADRYPDSVALRCDGVTTTYSQLADSVCRFAEFLVRQGITPGDRVGVMLPNRPEFVVVLYSVLHEGAVAVPMNPLQNAREVAFFLSNTGAKTLFFAPECAAAATAGAQAAGVCAVAIDGGAIADLTAGIAGFQRPLPRAADDNAVILHTSGTTGVPKGAKLTHANLSRNQAVVTGRLLDLGPDDVVMGSSVTDEHIGHNFHEQQWSVTNRARLRDIQHRPPGRQSARAEARGDFLTLCGHLVATSIDWRAPREQTDVCQIRYCSM